MSDLARRVHDLVRSPQGREPFVMQINAYLADRARNRGQSFPLHLLDADLGDPEEANSITMLDKYAALGAVHDLAYANDGPIMPPGDCETVEGRNWHLTLSHMDKSPEADLQVRFARKLEDWYKDVVAELAELRQSVDAVTPVNDKPVDAAGVEPAKYLKNWREILDCLKQKNNGEVKRWVAAMNREFDGPINLPARGGQPKVEKTNSTVTVFQKTLEITRFDSRVSKRG